MNQPASEESSSKAHQRSLVLMRHAKSDWSDDSLADRDRPLNHRGRRDSGRMAKWLQDIDRLPTLVLCSSATRTRQTLELMLEVWDHTPQIIDCENLYLAAADEIFDEIRTFGSDEPVIMALAHNPGMSYAASIMADQSIEMPTAAIAVFDLMIDSWQSLHQDADRQLAFFMRPKALPKS
jgi:phosphohistidine phosphatase